MVLNAAQVVFIDIDFPRESGLKAFLRSVRRPFGTAAPGPEEDRLRGIEEWARMNPGWGMRIYRTFGGFRCVITDRLLDPVKESTLELLKSLKSDPLYIRLCQRQECFRARLSPKPWRCGARKPPSRYPWETGEAELKFRRWEEKYRLAASRYTACRLVKELRNGRMYPDVDAILSVHDRLSCLGADRGLA